MDEPSRTSSLADLQQLKDWLTEAEDFLIEPRKRQERDEDWYHDTDNDQWAKEEKVELRHRGQLITTFNEIKAKVDFQLGMEQRARTDPKALPRKPDQQDMADVATDVLVYVEDQTKFDRIATEQARELTIGGTEAVEVVWDGERIVIEAIRSDEFFYDPRSSKPDFSDARFIGYSRWFDLDSAKALYPDSHDALQEMYGADSWSTLFRDRPDFWATGTGKRRRMRLVVMYYKDARGGWHLAHFTGRDTLFHEISPYHDDKGQPSCAIVARSRYVSRNNERYGDVRGVIGAQQTINHYLAKIWSLVSSRRTWGMQGVVQDTRRFKGELARVDGHVEVTGIKDQQWGFIDDSAEVQGLILLIQEARAYIQRQGPNAAMMGRGTEGQSGRAILAQQDAGATEKSAFLDAHNAWKEAVFAQCFGRVKQFWTQPMFIRIADDEEKSGTRFVGLNEPVLTEQGVALKNQLGALDVDIILDSVPDFANLQAEEFEKISQMVQAGLPILPTAVVEASNLRDKRKVLAEMRGETEDPAQQQAQQQAMAMQQEAAALEMQLKKAETEDKIASARLRTAQAQKALAEIGQVEAETRKTEAETTVIPFNARKDAMETAHRLATTDNPREAGL